MNCDKFKVGQEVVTTVPDYGIPVGTKGVIDRIAWHNPTDKPLLNGAVGSYVVRFAKGLVRYNDPPTTIEEKWAYFDTELRPYEEAAPAVDSEWLAKLLAHPDITAPSVNDAAWAVVKALPTCPPEVFNHIKGAFHRGLCEYLTDLVATVSTSTPTPPVAWRSDAKDSGV